MNPEDKKKLGTRYTLQGEEKEEIIKVRHDKKGENRKKLDELKTLIDVDKDATAYKIARDWMLNDLKSKVGKDYRIKIIRKKR